MKMEFNLKNKLAIVTGNSRGIGKAITQILRDEGVCVPDISRTSGYDLTTEDGLSRLLSDYPKCDILCNSVGGGGRWGSEIPEETDIQIWNEVYQKNAGVAVRLTMHYLPNMINKNWGRVVTISSIYGYEGGGRPWFNMAKSAEISLMKCLSMMPRYATKNITFNSVAPGFIMIPNTGWEKIKNEHPDEYSNALEKLPTRRFGTPEEVANAVVFLCSEKASFINGATISVDGGLSKRF